MSSSTNSFSNTAETLLAAAIWAVFTFGMVFDVLPTGNPDAYTVAQSENQPSRPMLYRIAAVK